jgi:hypothetical protein
LRFWSAAGRWSKCFKRWLQRRRRNTDTGARRRRKGGGALQLLTREAAMLRGGADPGAVGLCQVYDKAIVGGLERKRISTRELSGADRWTDFGDRPDFLAPAKNVVRHGLGRANAMEDEIVVDDFAGQPGTTESRREARRQGSDTARRSVCAAGKHPCDGAGRAGRCSGVRRRYGDFGDDGLSVEEQRLNDRTLAGGSARQQIRIAKLLRRLGSLLRDRNPVGNGPADDSTCQDGTKVATMGASHITSSQHYCVSLPPVFRPAFNVGALSFELAVSTPPSAAVTPHRARMHLFGAAINDAQSFFAGRADRRRRRSHGPQLSDRSMSRQ